MIKLEEFYDKVKLPINEELLNKLLEKYFSIPLQSKNYQNGLYDEINKDQKTVVNEIKIESERKRFLAKLNQDFANAGKPFNPDTHNGLMNPLGEQIGWATYKSWNLIGTERIHYNDQVHRLYISVSSNDRVDFTNELYDEFKRNSLPFYFKVSTDNNDRPDKVVIYTSTQLLEKTLKVLDNIEKRRPDLIKNCNFPSIITGKVTPKIGYASEIVTEGNKSYTQIICDTFVNAIEKITDEYSHSKISETIYNMYQKRLEETQRLGIKLEDSIKKRIACEILMQYDHNFKIKVLNAFRENIKNVGLDPNNMCFSAEAKRQIKNRVRITRKVDIFDPKVLNEVITLPNGTELTIDEYLKINKVWPLVPLDSIVTLGTNGKTMSGKEFIEGIIQRAGYYNNLDDLIKAFHVTITKKDNGLKVEQNKNAKVNKKIKNYSLEEIEDLFKKYNLIKDTDGEFKVIDRKTNIIYEGKNFVDKVKFAHTWVAATRYGRSLSSPNLNGITESDYAYAFDEKAKEVYDNIMALASINMKTSGVLINPQTLENEITNYVNYKYAKSIVRGLYSEERFKESFKNWLRMANNIPIIEENQNFHR